MPRELRRPVDAPGETHSQALRKQQQLCRQVERRLGLVFAGEVADPLVQEAMLVSVRPDPFGGALIVTLALPEPLRARAPELLRRLEQLQPLLRAEVAAEIHRKHTPVLRFRVASALELTARE